MPRGKPFQKGNPGRKPGTQNKVTQSVRGAFKDAFDQLGGAKALADWGRDNPSHFYPLASKLIPTEIAGAGGGALLVEVLRKAAPQEPSDG